MLVQDFAGEFKRFPLVRVLVTGAEGMLGQAFVRALRTWLPQCEVKAFGHQQLDVTQRDSVMAYVDWLRGGWIIHCAALVNVEKCETDPASGEAAIVQGAANICALASASGAKIFYPQTFLIYPGGGDAITENTQPQPLCRYGEFKLQAERLVLEQSSRSLVVRMAGFFGGEEKDKNFVGKILPVMVQKIRSGESSLAVGERVWQPTYTMDLASNVLALLVRQQTGVFQMASHGEASFFELAEEIARLLKLNLRIEKAPAAVAGQNDLGRRPERAVMLNQRLQAEGLDLQRPWQEALAEYLQKPYFQRTYRYEPETPASI